MKKKTLASDITVWGAGWLMGALTIAGVAFYVAAERARRRVERLNPYRAQGEPIAEVEQSDVPVLPNPYLEGVGHTTPQGPWRTPFPSPFPAPYGDMRS